MNKRVIKQLIVIFCLSVTAVAAPAADRGVQLSESVAEHTDRILQQANEALSQRIVRETSRRLSELAERDTELVLPAAMHSGRTRRSVSLQH